MTDHITPMCEHDSTVTCVWCAGNKARYERQVHNGDGVAVKIKREPRKKLKKSEVRNG